jgi:hypothetical protein
MTGTAIDEKPLCDRKRRIEDVAEAVLIGVDTPRR